MKLGKKMKNIWESMHSRGCHLGISGEEDLMMERFKNLLAGIKTKNKIVIDYGCGGAILGKYLFEAGEIKKYIGFDLAEKSIKKANERLERYDNKELFLVETHDIDFKSLNPDIICCFACIIHWPNQIYLDRYLKRFNESNAKYLILEIRNKDCGTIFQKKQYESFARVIYACITEPEYLEKKLANYKLYKMTDFKTAPTNCQVLYFKKMEN